MSDLARPRAVASFGLEGDDWGGVLRYGPLVPDERTLRLLGNVASKRVLVLGAGGGQAAAALAGAGAKVIVVEPTAEAVALTRSHCQGRGLSVEVHQRDLAELAFVRADTVDLAVSVLSLATVGDLARVFRQVHRVLRSEAALVLSLPHPTVSLLESGPDDTVHLRRAYTEPQPRRWGSATVESPEGGSDHTHTIEATFTALTRTGFRVDALLEPLAHPGDEPGPYWVPAMAYLPAVLVVRARKLGV